MARQTYRESVPQEQLGVDREAGCICGVKVLGLDSLNGRRYDDAAVKAAIGLYEGAKVNLNHVLGDRNVLDRFGKLVGVEHRPGKGLWAARLVYNPEHVQARQILWFAEHMPDALGLSHDVLGDGEEGEDGILVITHIESVRSVDLVAEPATADSLYESRSPMKKKIKVKDLASKHKDHKGLQSLVTVLEDVGMPDMEVEADGDQVDLAAAIKGCMQAIMDDTSLDSKAMLDQLKKVAKLRDELNGKPGGDEGGSDDSQESDDGDEDEDEKPDDKTEAIARKLKRMEDREVARELCEAKGLKTPAKDLIEDLCDLGDKAKMTRYLDRIIAQAKASKPKSAGRDTRESVNVPSETASVAAFLRGL